MPIFRGTVASGTPAVDRRRWAGVAALLLTLILGPFALFGDRLDALAVEWLAMAPDGPFAAGCAALLTADVFLPVPSSVVGVAAGARLGGLAGAAVVFAGLQAGCALAWGVARTAGAPVLDRLVGPAEQERARRWLSAPAGSLFLAACRPVPVMGEATVLVAGGAGVPLGRFLAVTGAANAGVAAYYGAVGALSAGAGSMGLAVLGAIALPAVAMAGLGRFAR